MTKKLNDKEQLNKRERVKKPNNICKKSYFYS